MHEVGVLILTQLGAQLVERLVEQDALILEILRPLGVLLHGRIELDLLGLDVAHHLVCRRARRREAVVEPGALGVVECRDTNDLD